MKNLFLKIAYIFFFIVLAIALFKFLMVLLLVGLVLLWLRTFQMKSEPNQVEFAGGSLPNPSPDGFYHGKVGFETSWIGKKFDATNSTGINVLRGDKDPASATGYGVAREKYPFTTYKGNGLFDPNTFVLKIDYNVPGNPLWVKFVVDEIVQVAPDQYLGKMQLKLIPGFPFSVLYFELKK